MRWLGGADAEGGFGDPEFGAPELGIKFSCPRDGDASAHQSDTNQSMASNDDFVWIATPCLKLSSSMNALRTAVESLLHGARPSEKDWVLSVECSGFRRADTRCEIRGMVWHRGFDSWYLPAASV